MLYQSISYLYQISLRVIFSVIYVLSIFNKNIYKWLQLRKDWKLTLNGTNLRECIWIHAASVGEFEMTTPVIKQIKKQNKKQKIVVSFFSISGIQFYTKHELVDYFFLLPKDYKQNIQYIINAITPKCLIIAKNERWLNLIYQTYLNKVPIYQIEVEKKNYNFLYLYYINYLNRFFTKIFYVENGSLQLENVLTYQSNSIENIKEFCSNNFTIILGSCYIEEVKIVAKYYNQHQNIKIIICPHNIASDTFDNYQKLFNIPINIYSSNHYKSNLLFIDKMGLLKNLYQYADIAFIGGGFNFQLHNIFEAGAWKNIVITGNCINDNYLNKLANESEVFYKIKNSEDFTRLVNTFRNSSDLINKNKENWGSFFKSHRNVSQEITKIILADL